MVSKSLLFGSVQILMSLILLWLVAFSAALPLNESEEDNIDEELILGSSCTIEAQQADGNFDFEQIKECGSCWEEIGDKIGPEETKQAEEGSSQTDHTVHCYSLDVGALSVFLSSLCGTGSALAFSLFSTIATSCKPGYAALRNDQEVSVMTHWPYSFESWNSLSLD